MLRIRSNDGEPSQADNKYKLHWAMEQDQFLPQGFSPVLQTEEKSITNAAFQLLYTFKLKSRYNQIRLEHWSKPVQAWIL